MKKTLVIYYRWVVGLLTMLVAGILASILFIISFGLLRNFSNRTIFKYYARLLLRIMGYRYKLPKFEDFPSHQVMYTLNHNSYLDTFILIANGFQNTRFILSEVTFKFIPMVISAKAWGTFYIPMQDDTQRRLKFFKRVTQKLKDKNYSIIASPEGVSPYIHGINPFNRGIFHMALESEIPIVPLYIHMKDKVNPYKGKYSESGILELRILNEISTTDWKLENLENHINDVRKVYVDYFNQMNNTAIQ